MAKGFKNNPVRCPEYDDNFVRMFCLRHKDSYKDFSLSMRIGGEEIRWSEDGEAAELFKAHIKAHGKPKDKKKPRPHTCLLPCAEQENADWVYYLAGREKQDEYYLYTYVRMGIKVRSKK